LAERLGFRRIATRYDGLARNYFSALCLVAAAMSPSPFDPQQTLAALNRPLTMLFAKDTFMNRRDFVCLAVGAMVAWSSAVLAQSKTYSVAFLALEPGEEAAQFSEPLRELGYVEGRNLTFEHRSADGDPARLAALADELVRIKPDVLVAGWGTLAPKALKSATTTIPIVFATVGDPIGAGLVQNLARPGGNITGLSGQSTEFKSKQLQLLLTSVPDPRVVGVFLNPDTPYSALALKELRVAADRDGIRLELLEVRSPAEFTAARVDALVASGATSLFIIEDPLASNLRTMIVDEANRRHLPTMTGLPDFSHAGALMTYGAIRKDRYRRAAEYVDKILRGASPGDLPVEQPTKFQLVVNLKTANAIGVAIPTSVLAIADEVIE
jgi:putative ABC transport system substrate-binding protein